MRSSGRRVSPRGEVTQRRKSYGGSELDTAAQADLNTMRPVRKVVQLVVVRAAGSSSLLVRLRQIASVEDAGRDFFAKPVL